MVVDHKVMLEDHVTEVGLRVVDVKDHGAEINHKVMDEVVHEAVVDRKATTVEEVHATMNVEDLAHHNASRINIKYLFPFLFFKCMWQKVNQNLFKEVTV